MVIRTSMITGMNGTVAPVLAKLLSTGGGMVVPWNRSEVPVDHPAAVEAFIIRERPDCLFHLAMGDPSWAGTMARVCREQKILFVHTGTVSVFSNHRRGPFTIHDAPDAEDDYGSYKRRCEAAILEANPDAIIARLGWQIGHAPGSNNMVEHLTRMAGESGVVDASDAWLPSCAFLEDSADALVRLAERAEPGLYQLEGNPGLSFFDIAEALAHLHDGAWQVRRTHDPDWDNRMADDRIRVAPITERLPGIG